jgi:hypothetical protein
MFSGARDSDMDLADLGARLEARKAELEDQGEDSDDTPPPRGQKERSRTGRMARGAR